MPLKLPRIFSDHMVLQRDIPAPIWGWASPGQNITIDFSSHRLTTRADLSGKWKREIPASPAGGPFDLLIRAGDETAKISDVLIGDVWLCSGQSNMEWTLNLIGNHAAADIASANDPNLRHFTAAKNTSLEPVDDVTGTWNPINPQNAGGCSAVGYFMARELRKTLNVPIGIIISSWGGTPAECWVPRSALESEAVLRPILPRIIPPEPMLATAPPTSLYNAMIAPLINFALRGATWYQGESNTDRAFQYRTLLPALIRCWRQNWNQGEFPFLIVQLANWLSNDPNFPNGAHWAELREAQAMAETALPNVGLAIAIDIGETNDIHPRNKLDVGRRLALAAQALAYNQKIEYHGPTFDSIKITGDTATITFKHAEDLMTSNGENPQSFELAGPDRIFYPADATINAQTITLKSKKAPNPIAARYAWSDDPKTNLYNKQNLPAAPFRTDDWPALTESRL